MEQPAGLQPAIGETLGKTHENPAWRVQTHPAPHQTLRVQDRLPLPDGSFLGSRQVHVG